MIIDSHVHYNKDYPIINKACIFSFCEEIYERNNPDFKDNSEWRKKRQFENEKNLNIEDTIAYLFMWTDFNINNIEKYGGIKLHRHSNEPKYDWNSKKAKKALDSIRELRIPVILDDEPHRVIEFIKKHAMGINVIIPHFLRYNKIKQGDVLHLSNVYIDTSLAVVPAIIDYIKNFGVDRILYGSDWPYGDPAKEVLKILKLPISIEEKKKILGINILNLLKKSKYKQEAIIFGGNK